MNRMKACREATGLTQAEVAEKIGVSQSTVAVWETGGLPNAAKLPQIAALYKCEIGDLFEKPEEVS